MPNKSEILPDGLDLFAQISRDLNISVTPIIERACRWVDPKTFQMLPVWYPETHRGGPMFNAKYDRQYTNKRRGGEPIPKTEPNIQAGKAIRQAMGIPVSWRGYNWTVCHIWGIDDPLFQRSNTIISDPRYYSCVGNMVLLPTPLKAFTDSVPEIKYMLRLCAYNLYGWVPSVPEDQELCRIVELVKSEAVPTDYPATWPRKPNEKLPLGLIPYSDWIGEAIRKRKKEIKSRLESEAFPLFPREKVRSVLDFWEIIL
jgi:hypothetical protein